MKITFLGSGGAFTDYRVNYQNNALVETAEGPVLIDCGFTAVQSLRELGVPAWDVRAVCFTHLHADHASPEQLIWERYYTGPDGPGWKKTELVAPEDLLDPLGRSLQPFMDIYTDHLGKNRQGGVAATTVRQMTHETEIGGVRFRWFRVPHVTGEGIDKAAYGIEISQGEKRVLWSGDTTLSERWVREAAADPRVVRIFHECTFSQQYPGTVHTHFEELQGLGGQVTGKITLMHHTEVPEGVDLAGFVGAARRHERFEL